MKPLNNREAFKDNIILIGMPASGKSTIGDMLARKLGYEFIDTDILIQRKENAKLEELIRVKGLDTFLDIESDVCCSLEVKRTVIATGGSVIYRDAAMQHLKEIGMIIYLEVKFEDLKSRLLDMKRRGVVFKNGQTLLDVFQERKSIYEKYADIIVNESQLDALGIANRLVEYL